MKNLMRVMCAGSLMLAMTSVPVSKANADDNANTFQGYSYDIGMGHLFALKMKLKLTDHQTQELKNIAAQAKTDLGPSIDQLREDLKDLKDKVDAKADGAELKPVLDKINTERKDLESAKEKYVDQVRDVLTPKQQACLVLELAKKNEGVLKKMGNDDDNK